MKYIIFYKINGYLIYVQKIFAKQIHEFLLKFPFFHKMTSLLDPFTFPKNKYHQKVTIPNRAFRTAIGMALCSSDWLPLPELINFYKSISSADAGMYTLEQCAVHESGKAIFPQLGIHDDKFIPYH